MFKSPHSHSFLFSSDHFTETCDTNNQQMGYSQPLAPWPLGGIQHVAIPKSPSLSWFPLYLFDNGLPRHLIQFHHLHLSRDFALLQDPTFAIFILLLYLLPWVTLSIALTPTIPSVGEALIHASTPSLSLILPWTVPPVPDSTPQD